MLEVCITAYQHIVRDVRSSRSAIVISMGSAHEIWQTCRGGACNSSSERGTGARHGRRGAAQLSHWLWRAKETGTAVLQ